MSFDLESLDDDFVPGEGGKRMTPEDLADGKYEFEVAAAQIKFPKEYCVLELTVEVISAGLHTGDKVQHAIFVKDKDSAARVGKDLKTLGFDVDEWTKANGRPFSQEFQKVTKCLKGVRFRGTKKANKSGAKVYHNLYINERMNTDGLPEVFGPEQLDAADPDAPQF